MSKSSWIPVPKAVSMVRISAFPRIRSSRAFSTFRILRQGLEKPLPSLRQIEVFNDHFGGDHERLESVIRARENQLMYAWRDYEQRLEGFGLEKDDFTTVKDLFSTMMKKMRYHIQKHSEHKDEPFRVSEIPERDFRK